MTAPARPPRDDPPREDPPQRSGSSQPVRCDHPGIEKIDGKTCCAECGVQLYL